MPTRIGFDDPVDTYGALYFFDLLVNLGLDRIVTLHHRLSTSYQIR